MIALLLAGAFLVAIMAGIALGTVATDYSAGVEVDDTSIALGAMGILATGLSLAMFYLAYLAQVAA